MPKMTKADAMKGLDALRVWRDGFAPLLSTPALTALLAALDADNPRLAQGCTTKPPPLMCVQGWPVEAACALGYCGWQGEGLETVGEVEEYFAKRCYEADERLGEPAGSRHFLNWFDDTPRELMRPVLAREVREELDRRARAEADQVDWVAANLAGDGPPPVEVVDADGPTEDECDVPF